MTLLGYQLFSLGQRRRVKPYFSRNLRILFMDYKYVILYIRWNPKSWSAGLRMLDFASSWEVLYLFPAKEESDRMGESTLLISMLRDFHFVMLTWISKTWFGGDNYVPQIWYIMTICPLTYKFTLDFIPIGSRIAVHFSHFWQPTLAATAFPTHWLRQF